MKYEEMLKSQMVARADMLPAIMEILAGHDSGRQPGAYAFKLSGVLVKIALGQLEPKQ